MPVVRLHSTDQLRRRFKPAQPSRPSSTIAELGSGVPGGSGGKFVLAHEFAVQ